MSKGKNWTPDHGPRGGLKDGLRAIAPSHCGAKRASGTPCRQPAGFGTDHPGWGHCQWHYGSSPTGKAHAQKVRTEVHATRAVLDLGLSVDTTPERALSDEINRSVGMVTWIQQQLQEWEIDEDGKVQLEWVVDGEVRQIRVPALVAITSHPASAAVMQAYRDERAHLARVAKMGVDANLIARQQKLDEQRLDLMNDLLTAVITDLGHDPNDNEVRSVVSTRLRALSAS